MACRTITSLLAAATLLFPIAARAQSCVNDKTALGVARVVEIDAASGPIFGSITTQAREHSFLGPKEVVLTFDDGPLPSVTRSVLDTLDRFCTKATFFSVGRMAIAYPEYVREVLARGHTVGTHTWSHPLNLRRLPLDKAIDQIESGFSAVALAARQPIAPFFRFPGLSDSGPLMAHLQQRGIAAFTVDVVSNDSYISDSNRLIEKTLSRLQVENGGIILFHDIKSQTARALPTILSEIKARGYQVVHLRSKTPFKPDERYTAALQNLAADRRTGLSKKALLAVTDLMSAPAPSPQSMASAATLTGVTVTEVAPPARDRSVHASAHKTAGDRSLVAGPGGKRPVPRRSEAAPVPQGVTLKPAGGAQPIPVAATAPASTVPASAPAVPNRSVERPWNERFQRQMENSGS